MSHAAKQAELKAAKKAQAERRSQDGAGAADSFVADAAAKDQLRDPATKNSLAQYGLGTAEATAQTEPSRRRLRSPRRTRREGRGLSPGVPSSIRSPQLAVNTAATGALDSRRCCGGRLRRSRNPLAVPRRSTAANAVTVTDKRTGKVVLADKPKPANQDRGGHPLEPAKGVPGVS